MGSKSDSADERARERGESFVGSDTTAAQERQLCREDLLANTLRRSLEQYFQSHGIQPRLVAEFEDSALLKVVGQHGHGIFPAPSVLEDELRRQYGVRAIGVAEGVTERYYGISVERRIKHPAVAAITEAARERIFKHR